MREGTADIDRLVEAWREATLAGDPAQLTAVRLPGYRVELPDGAQMDAVQADAYLAEFPVRRLDIAECRTSGAERDEATVILVADLTQASAIGEVSGRFRFQLALARTNRGWQIARMRSEPAGSLAIAGTAAPAGQAPGRLRQLVRRLGGRTRAAPAAARSATYLPYRPGEDFIRPPRPVRPENAELPTPPRDLWLGYNYPAQGAQQVEAMMAALSDTGFALRAGDRIMDLGCGAGRMIRHLAPLVREHEVWGLDISAEHILWCRENLSPPFRFATTTKVPALPFADGSFALIYCGSLFTHIDELADAWLCEVRRLLRPDGRAFITIHDERTVELFDDPSRNWSETAAWIRKRPVFEQARRQGFGMFTAGREELSQVFYTRDYFRAMTDQCFETLAVIDEAYFYQTGIVLAPR